MNKNLFKMALVAVLSAGMLLSGCSKDDDDDTKGSFSYKGVEAKFSDGAMAYFGYNMKKGEETFGLSVNLWSAGVDLLKETGTGSFISFDFISTSSTELPSGKYTYNGSAKVTGAFTFNQGTAYVNYNVEKEEGTEGEIYSGTVTIEKNGSTYKLIIDCEDAKGEKITGTYEGGLKYYDFSKENQK